MLALGDLAGFGAAFAPLEQPPGTRCGYGQTGIWATHAVAHMACVWVEGIWPIWFNGCRGMDQHAIPFHM